MHCILFSFSAKLLRQMSYLLGISIVLAGPILGQQSVSIEGQVRDARGQGISSGVEVRLETPGGTLVTRQPCDSDGHYQLLDLAQAIYRIVVTAEGYQTYQADVDISNAPRVWTVNVFLNPQKRINAISPELSLNDQAAPKDARKNYDKGVRAVEQKHYGKARLSLEKALAEYPCYARAKADLALVDVQERQVAKAEGELRQAIQCDAGYVKAYLELGLLYNVEKKFADGEAVLREGLRHSPAAWQFYYELGSSYLGMGRYKEAEEHYLKAQTFNADMPSQFHAKLADLYLNTRAYDRAFQEMQTYLRADPNGIYAASIRKAVATLESVGVVKPEHSQPPQLRLQTLNEALCDFTVS